METIFVACPAHVAKRYCLPEYIAGLRALTYPALSIYFGDNSPDDSYKKLLEKYHIGTVLRTPSEGAPVQRVITAMNLLRDVFLASDCEWFCSLEQDIIPLPTVFEQLLARKKPVISALVYHANAKHVSHGMIVERYPLVGIRKEGKIVYLTNEEVAQHISLVSADYVTMGCLLIHRSVLEKITFRYREFTTALGVKDYVWHDFCFCDDVKDLGEEIFVDLRVACAHRLKVNVTHTGFTESIR